MQWPSPTARTWGGGGGPSQAGSCLSFPLQERMRDAENAGPPHVDGLASASGQHGLSLKMVGSSGKMPTG